MKQIYILTTLLLFAVFQLNAQTVTLIGSCSTHADGDYELSEEINGKPSYFHSAANGYTYTIYWTGTRWELLSSENLVGIYNELDTPTPPATSLSPWTPEICSPQGIIYGNGTTTVLGVSDFELDEITIYPNPSSDYLKISGLTQSKNYRIYNVLGVEVTKGMVSDNDKINILNFANGVYFLELDNSRILKFMKK